MEMKLAKVPFIVSSQHEMNVSVLITKHAKKNMSGRDVQRGP